MNWLTTLNESQLQAVVHPDGPLFVVAGAGTGKTKTLTTKIAYLIMNKVEPSRILALTFTNKAAREMKERVIDMTGPYAIDVWMYTFHAFGLNILRKHIFELPYGYKVNFNVIDEEDGRKIISEIIKSLNLDSKMFSAKALKHLVSLYKCNRMDQFERTHEEKIYQRYQQYLIENQLLDFDDLLIYTLELFENHPKIKDKYQTYFRHILVDEFQDTDVIQYKILKILGEKHKHIFVVGDPDQSIYGFRGANYGNSEAFIKDFKAKQIVLEKNYRSTNYILKAANQLIGHNMNRPGKKNLESDLGLGEPIIYHKAQTDYQETFYVINEIHRLISQGYSYDDIAILYRNNALSRLFEDALIKEGMPYIIYGGISFYERREIKDALAYIRVIKDTNLDFYLSRIINVPKRSIGLKSIQTLKSTARTLNCSMFDAIDHVDLRPSTKKALLQFKELILSLKKDFDIMEDLYQIMPILMKKTGYMDMLKNQNSETAEDRMNNLRELQSVFTRGDSFYEGTIYEKLTQQLDQIALYTELDKQVQSDEQIKLATYHQVKGLEFKVVFMVVLEEGIFPSEHALMSSYELEEERRVAYVGITRAKEKLYMSYATRRMLFGQQKMGYPSRFINESRLGLPEQKAYKVYDTESHILATGDHVDHIVFGKGVVVSVEKDIATIAFALPFGVKQIIESHPSIKKIKK